MATRQSGWNNDHPRRVRDSRARANPYNHPVKTLIRTIGVLVGLVIVLMAGILLAGTSAISQLTSRIFSPGTPAVTTDTQMVESLTREQQVVLLSLGIQGITERTDDSSFMGVKIPGSDRATFLEYTFNAKLGFEGTQVKIDRTGEDSYLITIPAFTFIGYDDPTYKVAAEDNGVLAWTTPEIDTVDMVNTILSEDAKQKYLTGNEEVLEDQAKTYYTTIAQGLDKAATLTFKFADPTVDQ